MYFVLNYQHESYTACSKTETTAPGRGSAVGSGVRKQWHV